MQKNHLNFLDYKASMDYLSEDLDILSNDIQDAGITGKKVFITGGTGFLGSLIVKSFLIANRKYRLDNTIVVLVRSTNKANEIFGDLTYYGLRILVGEITQLNINEKFHYIIHTASPTSSQYFMTHPVEVLDINYQGTKKILELAKLCDDTRVVCFSSMEAFGSVEENSKRIQEKELGYIDLSSIRSCYSEGKRVLELLCKCYSDEYGVNVCVARLAQTFGAGIPKTDNRVFAQFAKSAKRGEDIVLHTLGKSVGNYCYTRDAIKGILTILLKGMSGETYTVVNESTTMMIHEMAKLVAQLISGGKSKVIFDIPKDNKYGYAPETQMRLSSEKLRNLGWKAEVGLADMYRRMIPYIIID